MFKKLPKHTQDKFQERLHLFLKDPTHPLLNNHKLHGEFVGCRSFNITADSRVVFEELGNNHIEFIATGSHSELYS